MGRLPAMNFALAELRHSGRFWRSSALGVWVR